MPKPEPKPELLALGRRLRVERERRVGGRRTMARLLHDAVDDLQKPDPPAFIEYLKRWESGRHNVSHRYRAAYAAVLGIPEEELFGPSSPSEIPQDRSAAVPVGTVDSSSAPDLRDDDVKRRQLIQDAGALTVGAAVAPVVAALTDAWQASQPRLPGSSVSRAMLDDWAAAYAVHVRSYVNDAPAVVLAGLARDWAEMAPHLAQAQPKEVERDLAHAAARHAYLIAGTAVQLGDPRLANRWWLTARALADRSGDNLLSAYARTWEVTNRVTDPREDPAELLALAQDARRRAGHRPTGTLIYATTVEAEVLAFMGRHGAAVATIRRAEEIFDRVPASEPNREELLRFDQSCVYALAGLTRQAEEAQRAARRFYRPDTHLYSSVQLSLYAAVAHARTDPGEASRQALDVLEAVPPDRRIKRVTLTARRVLDVVPEQARRLPAVRELQALTA
ncbi:hypothetical protein [Thermomonospora cellulosilytica]|uniref:Transcriptional regulator with XRE-family HTH domain n=1 Tax=Thermomonospora cellulosilytica TaxID=1411118 RepID=A0A7W3R765_9ACTN|nr:hypothetical protein [Thermomonospora cellulosilytica]MBA9001995.1 transcriptional regulator with XRE-family HTH domain [Thermomonospora cellulosilytica]